MKLSINQKSANALREYAGKMPAIVDNIVMEMDSLNAVYNNVSDSVGPHAEAFEEMLQYVKQFQNYVIDDIAVLSKMLNETADKMDAYIAKSALATGAVLGFGAAALINLLKRESITYLAVQKSSRLRSPEEIIDELSGGDITEGSCSSLALAYIGNRAGYYVLDFRGGESRMLFSARSSIERITKLQGVKSTTISGKNDIECVHKLLGSVEPGKEYYLATGQHAAIIRKSSEGYEYLELQHPSSGNGWHRLDDNELTYRFGCSQTRQTNLASYLIDAESLGNNQEFINMLGYINTAESQQRKGVDGNVR